MMEDKNTEKQTASIRCNVGKWLMRFLQSGFTFKERSSEMNLFKLQSMQQKHRI